MYKNTLHELMEATPEQIEGARRILKLRGNGLLCGIFSIPAAILVRVITNSNLIAGITAILFIIFAWNFLIIAASSKCPRCNKNFFGSWSYANGFTSKCVHCGLSDEK